MSNEILSKVKNVSKIFRLGFLDRTVIKAVDKVNLKVRKGEVLGILGESGSDKPAIAKMILKIYELTSGRILYQRKGYKII